VPNAGVNVEKRMNKSMTKILTKQRKYAIKNREKYNEYQRYYKKTHRDKVNEWRRRAKMRNSA